MNSKMLKYGRMLGTTILSSLLMAISLEAFVRPAKILSSGFTGISLLVNMVGSDHGINIPFGAILILLNIPVAYICYKKISWRFTIFSLLQVLLTSLFTELITIEPIFGDVVLNITFGGFLNGFAIALALKGGLSSGGTDFIALYVSNRWGIEIWYYVFAFNAGLLCIFGWLYGYQLAGYSILYQFISTKIIQTFYRRYKRVVMEIFTRKPDEVVEKYVHWCRHGITRMDGTGGFTKEPISMLITVTSVYEIEDTIDLIKEIDPGVIINVTKSDRFVGGFYHKPIE